MPSRTSYDWGVDCVTFRLDGTRVKEEVSLEEPEGRLGNRYDFAMDKDDVALLQRRATEIENHRLALSLPPSPPAPPRPRL